MKERERNRKEVIESRNREVKIIKKKELRGERERERERKIEVNEEN